MRYRRSDIVDRAVDVLDMYGLPDMSMRRIAAELGLQPSALYHHFASKQSLLAAVADEILTRGARATPVEESWDAQTLAVSRELRDAMLAYRDGAELVATVHAFGLGAAALDGRLSATISAGGFDDAFARAAATTILYFVFGHASDEQTHLQANSVGAIDAEPLERTGTESFELGLTLILDGIRLRHPAVAVTKVEPSPCGGESGRTPNAMVRPGSPPLG